MHQDSADDCQIEELALVKENLPYDRDILQEIRHEVLVKGELEPVGQGDIAADLKSSELSRELCHSGSECGHGKTCDVLVCPECHRNEGEDRPCQASDNKGGKNRKQDGKERVCISFSDSGLIEVGGNQSEDSAHVHDSLDS